MSARSRSAQADGPSKLASSLVAQSVRTLKTNPELRYEVAAQLRGQLEGYLETMSLDDGQTLLDQLSFDLCEIVNSGESMRDKLGGVTLIQEVTEAGFGMTEKMIVRFGNCFRILLEQAARSSTSEVVLLETATEALGSLAYVGGALAVTLITQQLSLALEWLHGRSKEARLAAVLVLKTFAINTPTQFNQSAAPFLKDIWLALRDPKESIRLHAIETLRVCLVDIWGREPSWKQESYQTMYNQACYGREWKSAAVHDIHGSLLVMGELVTRTGSFLHSDNLYQNLCDIVMGFTLQKSPVVQEALLQLIPRLANVSPMRFANRYRSTALRHIIEQLKPAAPHRVRCVAFVSLGRLLVALRGSITRNQLTYIMDTVAREFAAFSQHAIKRKKSKKHQPAALEAMSCVIMLARAFRHRLFAFVNPLIEMMFAGGMHPQLVDTLKAIVVYIPRLRPVIQERLLHQITDILSAGESGSRMQSMYSGQDVSELIRGGQYPQLVDIAERSTAGRLVYSQRKSSGALSAPANVTMPSTDPGLWREPVWGSTSYNYSVRAGGRGTTQSTSASSVSGEGWHAASMGRLRSGSDWVGLRHLADALILQCFGFRSASKPSVRPLHQLRDRRGQERKLGGGVGPRVRTRPERERSRRPVQRGFIAPPLPAIDSVSYSRVSSGGKSGGGASRRLLSWMARDHHDDVGHAYRCVNRQTCPCSHVPGDMAANGFDLWGRFRVLCDCAHPDGGGGASGTAARSLRLLRRRSVKVGASKAWSERAQQLPEESKCSEDVFGNAISTLDDDGERSFGGLWACLDAWKTGKVPEEADSRARSDSGVDPRVRAGSMSKTALVPARKGRFSAQSKFQVCTSELIGAFGLNSAGYLRLLRSFNRDGPVAYSGDWVVRDWMHNRHFDAHKTRRRAGTHSAGSSTAGNGVNSDAQERAVTLLALHTLSAFDFDFAAPSVASVTRQQLVRFLEHESPDVRLEAAYVCVSLLPKIARVAYHPYLVQLLLFLVKRLTVIAAADPFPVIRFCVLASLLSVVVQDPVDTGREEPRRHDSPQAAPRSTRTVRSYLAQSHVIQTLFPAVGDEWYPVRIISLTLLGRLSERNPAMVLPLLQQKMARLIDELRKPSELNPDTGRIAGPAGAKWVSRAHLEASCMLRQIIFCCNELVKPYSTPVLGVLLSKLELVRYDPRSLTRSGDLVVSTGNLSHLIPGAGGMQHHATQGDGWLISGRAWVHSRAGRSGRDAPLRSNQQHSAHALVSSHVLSTLGRLSLVCIQQMRPFVWDLVPLVLATLADAEQALGVHRDPSRRESGRLVRLAARKRASDLDGGYASRHSLVVALATLTQLMRSMNLRTSSGGGTERDDEPEWNGREQKEQAGDLRGRVGRSSYHHLGGTEGASGAGRSYMAMHAGTSVGYIVSDMMNKWKGGSARHRVTAEAGSGTGRLGWHTLWTAGNEWSAYSLSTSRSDIPSDPFYSCPHLYPFLINLLANTDDQGVRIHLLRTLGTVGVLSPMFMTAVKARLLRLVVRRLKGRLRSEKQLERLRGFEEPRGGSVDSEEEKTPEGRVFKSRWLRYFLPDSLGTIEMMQVHYSAAQIRAFLAVGDPRSGASWALDSEQYGKLSRLRYLDKLRSEKRPGGSSRHTDKIDRNFLPGRNLIVNDASFFPMVALSALVNIIKDKNSSMRPYHKIVTKSIMFVVQHDIHFGGSKVASFDFLPHIVPVFVQCMTSASCEPALRECILHHLCNLVVMAGGNVAPFEDSLLSAVLQVWDSTSASLLQHCLLIVQHLCAPTAGSRYRTYLPRIMPLMLEVITTDRTQGKLCTFRVLWCLRALCVENDVYARYLSLLVPVLAQLAEKNTVSMKVRVMALETLGRIMQYHSVKPFTSLIVHAVVRIINLPTWSLLHHACCGILCHLVKEVHLQFLTFEPLVAGVLQQHLPALTAEIRSVLAASAMRPTRGNRTPEKPTIVLAADAWMEGSRLHSVAPAHDKPGAVESKAAATAEISARVNAPLEAGDTLGRQNNAGGLPPPERSPLAIIAGSHARKAHNLRFPTPSTFMMYSHLVSRLLAVLRERDMMLARQVSDCVKRAGAQRETESGGASAEGKYVSTKTVAPAANSAASDGSLGGLSPGVFRRHPTLSHVTQHGFKSSLISPAISAQLLCYSSFLYPFVRKSAKDKSGAAGSSTSTGLPGEGAGSEAPPGPSAAGHPRGRSDSVVSVREVDAVSYGALAEMNPVMFDQSRGGLMLDSMSMLATLANQYSGQNAQDNWRDITSAEYVSRRLQNFDPRAHPEAGAGGGQGSGNLDLWFSTLSLSTFGDASAPRTAGSGKDSQLSQQQAHGRGEQRARTLSLPFVNSLAGDMQPDYFVAPFDEGVDPSEDVRLRRDLQWPRDGLWSDDKDGIGNLLGVTRVARGATQETITPHQGAEGKRQQEQQNDASTHKLAMRYNNLLRAWSVLKLSTEDDWIAWLRDLSLELLRESPSSALRACSGLAQKLPSLSNELMNVAFLSVWCELRDAYQDNLIEAMIKAITAERVPSEVHRSLLSVAEFMELYNLPLPIDCRLLGDLSIRCGMHANAIHYREREFTEHPSSEVVTELISLYNRANQGDAAQGLLLLAHQKWDLSVHETWYHKLDRREDALESYEARRLRAQLSDSSSTREDTVDSEIGRIRCLVSLGEFPRALLVATQLFSEQQGDSSEDLTGPPSSVGQSPTEQRRRFSYTRGSTDGQQAVPATSGSGASGPDGSDSLVETARAKSAADAVQAACLLGKWDALPMFLGWLEPSVERLYFQALYRVSTRELSQAQSLVEQALLMCGEEVAGLAGRSYEQSYQSLLTVQLLVEVEEIITYFKQPSPRALSSLKDIWSNRLRSIKRDADVWMRVLGARRLLLDANDMVDTYVELADLSRDAGRHHLSLNVLRLVLGTDPARFLNCEASVTETSLAASGAGPRRGSVDSHHSSVISGTGQDSAGEATGRAKDPRLVLGALRHLADCGFMEGAYRHLRVLLRSPPFGVDSAHWAGGLASVAGRDAYTVERPETGSRWLVERPSRGMPSVASAASFAHLPVMAPSDGADTLSLGSPVVGMMEASPYLGSSPLIRPLSGLSGMFGRMETASILEERGPRSSMEVGFPSGLSHDARSRLRARCYVKLGQWKSELVEREGRLLQRQEDQGERKSGRPRVARLPTAPPSAGLNAACSEGKKEFEMRFYTGRSSAPARTASLVMQDGTVGEIVGGAELPQEQSADDQFYSDIPFYAAAPDMLDSYRMATDSDPEFYQAWHGWALLNFKIVQKLTAAGLDRIELSQIEEPDDPEPLRWQGNSGKAEDVLPGEFAGMELELVRATDGQDPSEGLLGASDDDEDSLGTGEGVPQDSSRAAGTAESAGAIKRSVSEHTGATHPSRLPTQLSQKGQLARRVCSTNNLAASDKQAGDGTGDSSTLPMSRTSTNVSSSGMVSRSGVSDRSEWSVNSEDVDGSDNGGSSLRSLRLTRCLERTRGNPTGAASASQAAGQRSTAQQNRSTAPRRSGQTRQLSIDAHVVPAIQGFFGAILLQGPGVNVTQDCLRLLSLWFDHGPRKGVQEALVRGINATSLTSWLDCLPQMIARINAPDKVIRSLLHALLRKIGQHHPQALVYPLTVSAKDQPEGGAVGILAEIAIDNPRLVKQADLVSRELVRVAVLWRERWYGAIETASRHWFQQRHNLEGMIGVLSPMYKLLQDGPLSDNEIQFTKAYSKDLFRAWKYVSAYRKEQDDAHINSAWEVYSEIFQKLGKEISKLSLSVLKLGDVSPPLLEASQLDLCVPGSYAAGAPLVTIDHFFPALYVIESKQHPRKIKMRGSDGNEHQFLLKGHEDLRQDERVMQLFGLVNNLLAEDPSTSAQALSIQRYSAVPLSPASGLLEWVPQCDTIHYLVTSYRYSRRIQPTVEQRVIRRWSTDYPKLTTMQKAEVFQFAVQSTSGEDLAQVFWLKAPSASVWLHRRMAYTKSLAVMSMVGYILGLGDRHPCNLMIERQSGRVIHIDFGDCFEVALLREKFPEKVPFRLTRVLVNAMEVAGIEGIYRHTCHRVMRLLRKYRSSIMALLEAFLYDPLLTWKVLAKKNTRKQRNESGPVSAGATAGMSGTLTRESPLSRIGAGGPPGSPDAGERKTEPVLRKNEHALEVLRRVEDKLGGLDFRVRGPERASEQGGMGDPLSVEHQVAMLIEQATSVLNLCRMYVGWCPTW